MKMPEKDLSKIPLNAEVSFDGQLTPGWQLLAVVRPENPKLALILTQRVMMILDAKKHDEEMERIVSTQPYRFVGFYDERGLIMDVEQKILGPIEAGDSVVSFDCLNVKAPSVPMVTPA